MSSEMGRARAELGALTDLRFGLALYALVYHVLSAWNPLLAPRFAPFAGVVSAGYVAVNGFFVLSGFVLAYTYGARDGAPSASSFFRARFARIYPMHLVGILASLPLLFVASRAPVPVVAREAAIETLTVGALVQAWIPRMALALNGPAWSLSVEAFFYALFPLLVRALSPLRAPGLTLVLASSLVLAVVPPLIHPVASVVAMADGDRVVLFNPLLHLPELVAGMSAGLLFLELRPSGPAWRRRAAAAAGGLFLLLAVSPALPVGLLHSGLADALFVLLVYSLAAGWPPATARSSIHVLGRASYSLYVLHKPIYRWMVIATHLDRASPTPGFIAAYITATLLLSTLAWAWIEEPARQWLRREAHG